jgi:hypothetical protein
MNGMTSVGGQITYTRSAALSGEVALGAIIP